MEGEKKFEHLYFTVGNKKDFIVFNAENLTDEPITPDDIVPILRTPDFKIDSIVWSSNCRFFFVVSDMGLALFNTLTTKGFLCRKKSFAFIEMYLQGK
jgi:hypothetical protein